MKKVTDHIRIQTKTKKKQKSLEFKGTLIAVESYIFRDDSNKKIFNQVTDFITGFIADLQKNQKLELFINSKKIGNIKNLSLSNPFDKCILKFEGNFSTQTQENQKTIATRTSLQIFCDKWQKFDKHVDLSAVILAVFQRDPRMFQDFNIKSDEEQNEILKFAGELIHKKIQEL